MPHQDHFHTSPNPNMPMEESQKCWSPRIQGIHNMQHSVSKARIPLLGVLHLWVRWEGPGSGFDSSSGAGAAGGVWNSGNLEILEFYPFGMQVAKQDFQMA